MLSQTMTTRKAPLTLLGHALLGVLDACRDIRVISRAG